MLARAIAACVLIVGFDGCSAHTVACSAAQAEQADAAVDGMTDWRAVGDVHRRFAGCDDGSIAEGFSDAISAIMVRQWRTLPRLAELVRRDPGLEGFVLRHLDATLDTDRLATIARLSARSCPAGLGVLCRRINRAALNAGR